MEEDKLTEILQEKLGRLAKPVLNAAEKKFKLSPELRDEIAEKLRTADSREKVMALLTQYAAVATNKDKTSAPTDKLEAYLQPIVGKACATEVVKRMEEFHPELKGNDKLRDTFIKELDKFPDEDKPYLVAATLKISKIRDVLASKGDNSEFAESYKDLENITTRLLKNFYNIAKFAQTSIFDESIPDGKKLELIESPVFGVRTIVFNDDIVKTTPAEKAKEEIDLVIGSAAAGVPYFPTAIEYIAEKSAKSAEIIFDKKEYRHFSKWLKDKTVQDAQIAAVSGKTNTNMPQTSRQGVQNG